jgi:rod shape-determining protein MreC
MARRRDHQAAWMAFVVLGVTSVAVVDRAADPAEDAIGRVLAPAQSVLSAAGSAVDRGARGSRDVSVLREEVTSLSEENARLELAALKTNNLIQENASLRRLLDWSRERTDLDLRGASVSARAIAEEPGSLMHTIKIDAGQRSGVAESMAVATDRGLVGRVERTGRNWADVLLVTDPRSAVMARIERSRATGVVVGTPGGELRLRYVPQDLEGEPNVQVGDLVFTSGLSQEFPPMISIGQVVEVRQRDFETHQEAVVRPSVDLDGLEFVLVVKEYEPLDDEAP